ncbi:MAG: stage II sporulation protein P [Candidatus Heteroscillospira sp.]|jgi:stage II sporulation protein P
MKKGLTAAVLFIACTQLAIAAGAGEAAAGWLEEAITSGRLVSASLRYEHGEPSSPRPSPAASAEVILTQHTIVSPSPSPTPEPKPATIRGELELDNATSSEIDPEALLAGGLSLRLADSGPQILIMHTHGTESYTAEPGWEYEESDYARTTDCGYNMIRVGDELAAAFEEQGLRVIHDKGLYDYPSYTGSYTRSGAAVEDYLAQYPDISIVIDLHRDAIGSGDVVYKTMAEIPNQSSAQIMLLVGTGENGLSHPKWQENLKLALLMQERAAGKYPTLMRPLAIRKERYNQQLTTGSLIIEVGSNGNTLAEAITAVRLFAEAVSPALLELND